MMKIINNSLVEKFLNTDYDQYITTRTFKIKVLDEHKQEQEFMENRYVAVYDKAKPLISPTRIVSTFNPIASYMGKNESVKKAVDFGKNLSDCMVQIINNKQSITTKNKLVPIIIKNLYNEFKQRQGRPLVCEKHVLYQHYHGFIDCLCGDEANNKLIVLELKTRKSEKEAKSSDYFQACFYKNLVEKSLEAFKDDGDEELEPKVEVKSYVVVCSRYDGKVEINECYYDDCELTDGIFNFINGIRE